MWWWTIIQNWDHLGLFCAKNKLDHTSISHTHTHTWKHQTTEDWVVHRFYGIRFNYSLLFNKKKKKIEISRATIILFVSSGAQTLTKLMLTNASKSTWNLHVCTHYMLLDHHRDERHPRAGRWWGGSRFRSGLGDLSRGLSLLGQTPAWPRHCLEACYRRWHLHSAAEFCYFYSLLWLQVHRKHN